MAPGAHGEPDLLAPLVQDPVGVERVREERVVPPAEQPDRHPNAVRGIRHRAGLPVGPVPGVAHPVLEERDAVAEGAAVPLADGYVGERGDEPADSSPTGQVALDAGPQHDAVSYTHLRAHETPEQLVCRLLL